MSAEKIILLGVNHKTTPVELRERLAFSAATEGPLQGLADIDGCRELFFLSTCNRVEILFVSDCPEKTRRQVVAALFQERLDEAQIASCIYSHAGEEAVRHLFRVGAGLDSMVMGEPQILGQLKDAFRDAEKRGSIGAVLNRLLSKAFTVGKRIRSETGLGAHAVSISYAAVELARKIFGDLKGKSALLVGAGEMAELAARHLQSHGIAEIVIANRTLTRAMDLARCFGGQAVSLEEMADQLARVDILISSTGAPGLILRQDELRAVMRRRKNKPLFLIDIAVPRDLDPTINELDNVYLYDIDDLKTVVEMNRETRQAEAVKAERIVREEVLKFLSWLEGLEAGAVIAALRRQAQNICSQELLKSKNRLSGLDEGQRQAVERLLESVAAKILHYPVQYAKADGEDDQSRLATLRRVFGMDRSNRSD